MKSGTGNSDQRAYWVTVSRAEGQPYSLKLKSRAYLTILAAKASNDLFNKVLTLLCLGAALRRRRCIITRFGDRVTLVCCSHVLKHSANCLAEQASQNLALDVVSNVRS